MRLSRWMNGWVTIAIWALSLLVGCAEVGQGGPVTLSIAADGDTELMVGDSLSFTVRSVKGDGSSSEVTALAKCMLTGDKTGTLDGAKFTATAAGQSVIACDYEKASGTLVLTVRGPAQGETTIDAVQAGDIPAGSSLELKRVVVTALAPPTSSGAVDLFVQPEKGDAKSGLFVLDLRATQEPKFAVGDVIDVTGIYVETSGRSSVEAELIEKTGRATPRISDLTLSSLDLTKLESALVRVKNVAVRDPAYTSYTWLLSDKKDASLEVELDTYFFVPTTEAGSVLDAMTGIVFCSSGACGIAPRDEADLALCADCEKVDATTPPDVVDAGPPMQASIEEIQAGVVGEGSAVLLDDLVVTALWPDGVNLDFWAQKKGGGKSSGLMFRDARATATALTLKVGSVVHVEGVTALRSMYPVVNFTVAEQTAANGKVTVDTISVAALADEKQARPYWGALVEVSGVKTTAIDAMAYGVTVQDLAGSSTLFIGNALYTDLALAVGDERASVTGVVYVGASGLELWPRDAKDLVP